ncbi:MAG TPA: LLM class flavin-dependent oxidoreductase [Dehalococcoidia bacterium]|nr:LLM class flavin-dependent oxidoreductase [Dehalococcoidia bacterium]
MTIDFGWFLPTMGDTDVIGPPTRAATTDYLVEVATAAEDAGFVFALMPVGTTCHDAWLASAVVAARTRTLKFLVAMRPGFVAPTLAAKMSNTLDQLTQGRVLINVVTGGFPAELAADGDFMEHDERYARTQEFMQVVRRAWTEPKRWSHEGRYYRTENADVHPKPFQQPYPRFYFGGASEAAQKVGAEEADVYLLWGETVPMVRQRIGEMRERAARLGRTLRFGMRMQVVVRESDDAARAAADALVAGIPENFQHMVDRHMSGSDSEGERRQREMTRQDEWLGPNLWTGIGRARLGVGTALVGSGESVAARLREYVDEGIDTFILSGYPHLEEAQRFGRYVMPLFDAERSRPAAPRREMAPA